MGNGNDIKFWKHWWIEEIGQLKNVVTHDLDSKVYSLTRKEFYGAETDWQDLYLSNSLSGIVIMYLCWSRTKLISYRKEGRIVLFGTIVMMGSTRSRVDIEWSQTMIMEWIYLFFRLIWRGDGYERGIRACTMKPYNDVVWDVWGNGLSFGMISNWVNGPYEGTNLVNSCW